MAASAISEGPREIDIQEPKSSPSNDPTVGDNNNSCSWIGSLARWRPTSVNLLEKAEEKILSCVKAKYESNFVYINEEDKLRTLKFNPSKSGADDKTPIVLVHGFGSGVALWSLNFEDLSRRRPVYAFDLLGFGRSSRSAIPQDAEQAETEFVNSIENWRSKVGIEKMVLVGHSFGGYLTYSYSIRHPERVKHLVLADPWGFPEKPPPEELQFPLWVRAIGAVAMRFNPLSSIRAAGPLGPRLLKRVRGDLDKKFKTLFDGDLISNYIYHCNAQQPSGEMAFKSMAHMIGWAVNPMIQRAEQLSSDVPVTMIYGDKSWMDSNSGNDLKFRRKGAYVKIHILKGAGHHVYADRTQTFNKIISEIGDEVD
ncbi:(Lyso)-N-acylphosphatidylethanolamine lipase-like [Patiria miniata]|uniref:1-acylglycerol-3-phosphate O-acyltransferase ABHD5 n=1 Tax=Patiria miniata TaxID=46514 RepID=A0A914BL87_PATMI|nr:(Lyso)-N-acylphosphatidylethanolamine lipase-like [Patiria miniata]